MTEITLTFKKLLELNGQIDHNNTIIVKYIPKVIDYKSFIKIISSDSLCYIPASRWKHMVNKIDVTNNLYPLFWACFYRNFKTIMLLIKHGSVYSPYDIPLNEYNMNSKRVYISRVIFSRLKENSMKYFKIEFKKFCGVELSEPDEKIYRSVNDYTEVLKILVNQFPNFINNNDNVEYLTFYLYYSFFDISELLLRNANYDTLKRLTSKIGYIFNKYTNVYDNLVLINDYSIFMKEYYRYRILSMINFIKGKLIDKNIMNNESKILDFDELIKKKFGTFEIHDSIFYKLYIDENNFENYQEVAIKFNDLGMKDKDFIPVSDDYSSIMCLKTLSDFQNDELKYDKPEKIYNIISSKFEDYSVTSMMDF